MSDRTQVPGGTVASRLPSVVAIFPVVGLTDVAEYNSHQLGEARFRTNIVRKDQHAALTGLDADQSIGSLSIVAALKEAVALRTVKYNGTQPRSQVLGRSLRGNHFLLFFIFEVAEPDKRKRDIHAWGLPATRPRQVQASRPSRILHFADKHLPGVNLPSALGRSRVSVDALVRVVARIERITGAGRTERVHLQHDPLQSGAC